MVPEIPTTYLYETPIESLSTPRIEPPFPEDLLTSSISFTHSGNGHSSLRLSESLEIRTSVETLIPPMGESSNYVSTMTINTETSLSYETQYMMESGFQPPSTALEYVSSVASDMVNSLSTDVSLFPISDISEPMLSTTEIPTIIYEEVTLDSQSDSTIKRSRLSGSDYQTFATTNQDLGCGDTEINSIGEGYS
ncbi:hypothetical protein B0O99DRAFT_598429 [Bisporella sp. PMI_857]|nr:hypothetical protein B0O99DRAFT_598429 [Bisporella sp. PMI_857]